MDKEFIFQKDFELIGENPLIINMTEENSMLDVVFEEVPEQNEITEFVKESKYVK